MSCICNQLLLLPDKLAVLRAPSKKYPNDLCDVAKLLVYLIEGSQTNKAVEQEKAAQESGTLKLSLEYLARMQPFC